MTETKISKNLEYMATREYGAVASKFAEDLKKSGLKDPRALDGVLESIKNYFVARGEKGDAVDTIMKTAGKSPQNALMYSEEFKENYNSARENLTGEDLFKHYSSVSPDAFDDNVKGLFDKVKDKTYKDMQKEIRIAELEYQIEVEKVGEEKADKSKYEKVLDKYGKVMAIIEDIERNKIDGVVLKLKNKVTPKNAKEMAKPEEEKKAA